MSALRRFFCLFVATATLIVSLPGYAGDGRIDGSDLFVGLIAYGAGRSAGRNSQNGRIDALNGTIDSLRSQNAEQQAEISELRDERGGKIKAYTLQWLQDSVDTGNNKQVVQQLLALNPTPDEVATALRGLLSVNTVTKLLQSKSAAPIYKRVTNAWTGLLARESVSGDTSITTVVNLLATLIRCLELETLQAHVVSVTQPTAKQLVNGLSLTVQNIARAERIALEGELVRAALSKNEQDREYAIKIMEDFYLARMVNFGLDNKSVLDLDKVAESMSVFSNNKLSHISLEAIKKLFETYTFNATGTAEYRLFKSESESYQFNKRELYSQIYNLNPNPILATGPLYSAGAFIIGLAASLGLQEPNIIATAAQALTPDKVAALAANLHAALSNNIPYMMLTDFLHYADTEITEGIRMISEPINANPALMKSAIYLGMTVAIVRKLYLKIKRGKRSVSYNRLTRRINKQGKQRFDILWEAKKTANAFIDQINLALQTPKIGCATLVSLAEGNPPSQSK